MTSEIMVYFSSGIAPKTHAAILKDRAKDTPGMCNGIWERVRRSIGERVEWEFFDKSKFTTALQWQDY